MSRPKAAMAAAALAGGSRQLVPASLVLASLLALAGCLVSIDYGSGQFLCEDGQCPNGEPCIDGVCGAQPADASPDAPVGAPRTDEHLIGNQLFLSFNDSTDFNIFRDGSRGRRDAFHNNATSVRPSGKFGNAVNPTELRVTIPDSPSLFFDAQGTTLEAWVISNAGFPALIGDPDTIITVDDSWLPTQTEVALYMGNPGGQSSLIFAVMEQCGGAVVSARVPFTLEGLVHVAATWDRSEVRFYKNGALEGDPQPLVAEGCELARNYTVGSTVDATSILDGFIDEVKISRGVKTASEIAESMSFDSSAVIADCGNLVLEDGEDCDNESMCCELSTCRFVATGTSCGSGTCESGLCRVTAARSSDDLLALYDFNDAEGTSVLADTSGVVPALDLTLSDTVGTLVAESALTITAEGIDAASLADTSKIVDAVAASGAFSVEAWVQPANLTQRGPARIVSLSLTTAARNFTLGQTEDAYVARVGTSLTNSNANPDLHSNRGVVVTTKPAHVVLTVDGAERKLWVDGVLVEQSTVGGTFAWTATHPLHIGNEGGGLRSFLGTFHLIAIYGAKLDETRIAEHFLAGPQ